MFVVLRKKQTSIDYVVAKRMWNTLSMVMEREFGTNFESVGVCWLSIRNK